MSKGSEKYEPYYAAGLSRNNRVPQILLPENVSIDDRKLQDDLLFLGSLSAYINYYDDHDHRVDSWHPFIAKSEPVLLAIIASSDLTGTESTYNEYNELLSLTHRDTKTAKTMADLFDFIAGLAIRIDQWYHNLSKSKRNSVLDEIELMIVNRLRPVLVDLKAIKKLEDDRTLFSRDLVGPFEFDDVWLAQTPSISIVDVLMAKEDVSKEEKTTAVNQTMRHAYSELYRALYQIVTYTRTNLRAVLEENQSRRPDTALLISFLKLMEDLRGYQNKITKRHLDFYYGDVLRMKELPITPDRVIVQFEPKADEDIVLLPKGTGLAAGKDNYGKDLVYLTTQDIFVNQGKVGALRSLFVGTEEVPPEKGIRLVGSIHSSDDPTLRNDGSTRNWWPVLGRTQDGIGAAEADMREATIGFSIASSALFLSEGKRQVNIFFDLDPSDAAVGGLRKLIQYVMEVDQCNFEGAVFRLMGNAFTISITTADGWMSINRYAFTYNDASTQLELGFSLTASDPAVTGYVEKKHGPGYTTSRPILRLLLNTYNAPYYAYSALNELRLKRIRIRTDVKDIRGLNLFGSIGKLSADKPFQPFGPLPMPGAYFLVGHAETFSKKLEAFTMRITWQDLPVYGFKTYFQNYPDTVENTSYTVGVSLLQDGYFLPLRPDQQTMQLFTDAPTDHPERGIPVEPQSVLDKIDLQHLRQRASWRVPEQADISPAVYEGYIRLDLLTPPMGFGANDYAKAVSAVVNYNAKKRKKDPEKPLPSPPYAPTATAITLDYTATLDTDSLQPDKGMEEILELYHHHPFGSRLAADGPHIGNATLIPAFDDEGYLFIGLTGIRPQQSITLFFQLSDDSLYSVVEPDPLRWHYLSRNAWRPLPDDFFLADSTQSLIQSGVIEVTLPADITEDNTILPSGYFWLALSVQKNSALTSFASSVTTQAVEALWVNRSNDLGHLNEPLAPGSITKLIDRYPAINKVNQPLPSHGGRGPETRTEYYVRISERLGHRMRAIQPPDFEALIMQEFPSVYKVKCFPGLSGAGYPEPGKVLVVVLPVVDKKTSANAFRPRDSFARLQDMKHFLQKHVSPFVSIEVRNPVYERLKVACHLRFKPGNDPGWCLRQLNDEMSRYLSPWLFNDGVEVQFGGSVSRSDVMGFIERRPYVDFVTALSLVLTMEHDGHYAMKDTARLEPSKDLHSGDTDDDEVLRAGKPWSVLVTSANHAFTVIDSDTVDLPEKRGIDNLVIGDDFLIAPES